MGRAPTFPLFDRILDGKLAELLTGWRDEGLSYLDISFKLRSEHELTVSPSTIQRWIEQGEDVGGAA